MPQSVLQPGGRCLPRLSRLQLERIVPGRYQRGLKKTFNTISKKLRTCTGNPTPDIEWTRDQCEPRRCVFPNDKARTSPSSTGNSLTPQRNRFDNGRAGIAGSLLRLISVDRNSPCDCEGDGKSISSAFQPFCRALTAARPTFAFLRRCETTIPMRKHGRLFRWIC